MKKHIKFIFMMTLGLIVVGTSACFNAGDNAGDNAELIEAVENDAFIVDVRTPEEFSEGSAPGAVNIPLSEIESQLGQFKGKGEIIVFCRSGNRSGQAKKILEENGFEKVLNGGTWQEVKSIIEEVESADITADKK